MGKKWCIIPACLGESPSWLRHRILIPACEGSSPSSPAKKFKALLVLQAGLFRICTYLRIYSSSRYFFLVPSPMHPFTGAKAHRAAGIHLPLSAKWCRPRVMRVRDVHDRSIEVLRFYSM